MEGMRFEAPESIDAAISLLASASGDARVLAGGTDLLVQLRADMIEPELMVDIKRIAETRTVIEEDGGFRVGAGVAGAELKEHASFPKIWPGVMHAFDLIGSTQIQGRCTLAGNLCNASPAADSVPAMVAVGAIAHIAGPNGAREVPVEDIPKGPGQTSLAKGEFVVSIFFPKKAPNTGDDYLRFIPRTEMDIAVVGSGVCLTLDKSGTCTAAKVALGAVAPTVILVPEAANALVGTTVDEAAIEAAGAAATAAAKPISDKRGTIEYRKKVAGVLTRRALATALERAKG
ncbi:MAG: Carbon monoxide dehydrogenase medium chain [Alphaproteobacteria bacterium MarineAlpha4_Bin2]|nr:MAG: Carbon monoxide dehydrogenase medium chain [Alphaproteobacteria bacterium MarineAlpha4_Bin2]